MNSKLRDILKLLRETRLIGTKIGFHRAIQWTIHSTPLSSAISMASLSRDGDFKFLHHKKSTVTWKLMTCNTIKYAYIDILLSKPCVFKYRLSAWLSIL